MKNNKISLSYIIHLVVISILSFGLFGFFIFTVGLTMSYHPNGIVLTWGGYIFQQYIYIIIGLWLMALVLPIFYKKKIKQTLKIIIVIQILIIPFYLMLSVFSRENYVTYYIGDVKHVIHSKYNPYNGSKIPGGEYFAIKLGYPSLKGQYESDVSQSIFYILKTNKKKELRTACDELEFNIIHCVERFGNEYLYFTDENGYFYNVSIPRESDMVYSNLSELKQTILSILNSPVN